MNIRLAYEALNALRESVNAWTEFSDNEYIGSKSVDEIKQTIVTIEGYLLETLSNEEQDFDYDDSTVRNRSMEEVEFDLIVYADLKIREYWKGVFNEEQFKLISKEFEAYLQVNDIDKGIAGYTVYHDFIEQVEFSLGLLRVAWS